MENTFQYALPLLERFFTPLRRFLRLHQAIQLKLMGHKRFKVNVYFLHLCVAGDVWLATPILILGVIVDGGGCTPTALTFHLYRLFNILLSVELVGRLVLLDFRF